MGKPGAVMISEAAAKFGLSRATLLYYDRIGVCGPSARSPAGYRSYDEGDLARLAVVAELRRSGVPLKRIARAARRGGAALAGVLLARLGEMNEEIEGLRRRQEEALGSLERIAAEAGLGSGDMEEVLAEAEIEAKRRVPWHDRFREVSPGTHERLVAFLRERASGRGGELDRLLGGESGGAGGSRKG